MVMSLPEDAISPNAGAPALFVAYIGDEARTHAFALTRRLRGASMSVVVDLEGRKLKRALAVADNLGAGYSLIIGEDEIRSGTYTLRNMKSGEQRKLIESEIVEALRT